MKLLLTGAGGYLGTVLVRQLLADPSLQLRLLDRLDYGAQPLMAVIEHRPFELLVGDIRDPRVLDTALDGVDQIIHLAAVVGYPACDARPQEADETNVEATRQLCARAIGRRVIFASTGSCYGAVEGLCTEETPLSPLTRYGRNKRDAEEAVQAVDGLILRFATLYGPSPRMRWDLLPNAFCLTAVRDETLRVYEPTARRTFLHVEDAAYLIGQLLVKEPVTGVYNVGTTRGNCTKGRLAQWVQRASGCQLAEADGHDPDARDYHVSYDKLARVIPWWDSHTIARTIPDLVQWARVWR